MERTWLMEAMCSTSPRTPLRAPSTCKANDLLWRFSDMCTSKSCDMRLRSMPSKIHKQTNTRKKRVERTFAQDQEKLTNCDRELFGLHCQEHAPPAQQLHSLSTTISVLSRFSCSTSASLGHFQCCSMSDSAYSTFLRLVEQCLLMPSNCTRNFRSCSFVNDLTNVFRVAL